MAFLMANFTDQKMRDLKKKIYYKGLRASGASEPKFLHFRSIRDSETSIDFVQGPHGSP